MGNEFWLAAMGIAGTFLAGPLATLVNHQVTERQRKSERAQTRSDGALQSLSLFSASVLEYRSAELKRVHARLDSTDLDAAGSSSVESARERRRECWQLFFAMSLAVRDAECRSDAEALIEAVEAISRAATTEQAVTTADQVRIDLRSFADKVADRIDSGEA